MITIPHVALGLIEARLRQIEGHDYFGEYILAYNKHLGVLCVKRSYFLVKGKWEKVFILGRYSNTKALEAARDSLDTVDLANLQEIFKDV